MDAHKRSSGDALCAIAELRLDLRCSLHGLSVGAIPEVTLYKVRANSCHGQ